MTHLPVEADRLRFGAAELGVQLGDRLIAGLLDYVNLLYAWNRSTRLTAIERGDAVRLHILDSLACVPFLRDCRKIVDLGSGPGLPGIVIASALADLEVCLVEVKRKRCSFLHEAIAVLGLSRCRVIEGNAEDLGPNLVGYFDAATARAFRSPAELVRVATPLLASHGKVLLMCGGCGLRAAERDALRACAAVSAQRNFRLPGGKEGRCIVVAEPHPVA